ncbi:MAG: hypothetical protein ACOC0P_02850 [Planctomycetota bacterium]
MPMVALPTGPDLMTLTVEIEEQTSNLPASVPEHRILRLPLDQTPSRSSSAESAALSSSSASASSSAVTSSSVDESSADVTPSHTPQYKKSPDSPSPVALPDRSHEIIEWIDDERARIFKVDDGGRLLVTASIDVQHDAITFFDPPLPLLTPSQEWNRPATVSVTARVEDRSRPGRVIDRGTGEFTSTLIGVQTVRLATASDLLETVRLETSLSLDLGRADVSSQSIAWLAPGIGPVARDDRERVRVLGPLGWTRSTRLVWSPSPR